METKLTDTDAVTAAMQPDTFKLDDFLADIAYPVETVTIHLDAYTANEKLKVLERKDELEKQAARAREAKKNAPRTINEADTTFEEIEKVQAEIDALNSKLEESALTFHMRGMEPGIVDSITKSFFTEPGDEENPDKNTARDNELIAKSIIKVVNAKGAVDEHVFTAEEVALWRTKLLPGEFLKLVQSVARVNLNGALFSFAVDAPFLGGRSDVAGE
jgi:hypothetical protein